MLHCVDRQRAASRAVANVNLETQRKPLTAPAPLSQRPAEDRGRRKRKKSPGLLRTDGDAINALNAAVGAKNSVPGPILKPCDRLLIVVSKFPLSFSSHAAVPFSAHTGHVTEVTNCSSFAIAAPCPTLLHGAARTTSDRTAIPGLASRSKLLRLFA